MKITIFIYIFILIKIISSNSDPHLHLAKSYEFDGLCQQNDESCMPNIDNSLTKILLNTTQQEKQKQIDIQKEMYIQKNIDVKNTTFINLGIFINQPVQQNDLLMKFNFKNIITSGPLNQNIFYLNTLLKQNQFTRNLMFKTSNYRKTENIGNRIILSLMYHLTHIKKSFLMGDLLSLPTKNHNLIKFTTHFEQNLIKKDQILFNLIKDSKEKIKQDYSQFMTEIHQFMNQEQITMFFAKNHITYDEYIYCRFIVNSRSHFIRQDKFALYPILHYANTKSIQDEIEEYYFEISVKNKNKFHKIKSLIDSTFGHQLLINYKLDTVESYPLFFGFMPQDITNYCFEYDVFDKQLFQNYNLPKKACLQQDLVQARAYSMIAITYKMNSTEFNQFQKIVAKYTSPHDYGKNFAQYVELLKRYDNDFFINKNQSFWQQTLYTIENQIELYYEMEQITYEYFNYRKNKNKDSFVAWILYKYYSFMFRQILRTKNDLLKLKFQYYI